jgi:hypothetical protein
VSDLPLLHQRALTLALPVLIYLFVIPYCFSWGGLVWVYISELFNTRTRAYGIAFANASQWLNNFALTRATPLMVVAMPNGAFFFFFFAMNMVNGEFCEFSRFSSSPC